jgi:phage terminase large subunit-like protein
VSFATLGPIIADWIERHCVIPDGAHMGEPFVLTAEMRTFVDNFYAVDLGTKKFVFSRGAQFIRPQKHGKGPFSAALICAEAAGPVLPLWDGDELVGGRPWETPWIQVTAVSEDQTANVFRALLPMIQLSPKLDMEIADTGLTRINLPGGGFIEPVTASARSRLGQRVTFVVQDETHSWVQANGGLTLADNQRRNLAGMGGRFMETTNAFDPVEGSVAQRTFESKAPGTLIDDREPPPGSIRNKRERRKVLQYVYGDSWWVDLDRIDQEIEALLEHDPAQAERFFLNRKLASEGAAFDLEKWKTLAKPRTVPQHSVVTLGVDGARHNDAIAVVATDVKSGYQWPLIIIERPEDADDEYEHDLNRVDGAVSEAFERYQVWRAYCDPHWIDGLIEGWQNRYGEKRVVSWLTNRPRPIAFAIRNFEQSIAAGDVSHSGDETFTRHIRNARRQKLTVLDDKQRQMHTLSKDSIRSPRKIDAAMAAVLSWEARGDCIAAGAVFLGDVPEVQQQPGPARWQPGVAPAMNRWGPRQTVGPMGSMS